MTRCSLDGFFGGKTRSEFTRAFMSNSREKKKPPFFLTSNCHAGREEEKSLSFYVRGLLTLLGRQSGRPISQLPSGGGKGEIASGWFAINSTTVVLLTAMCKSGKKNENHEWN